MGHKEISQNCSSAINHILSKLPHGQSNLRSLSISIANSKFQIPLYINTLPLNSLSDSSQIEDLPVYGDKNLFNESKKVKFDAKHSNLEVLEPQEAVGFSCSEKQKVVIDHMGQPKYVRDDIYSFS